MDTSSVNWGEIYYILHRSAGQPAAELALQGIDTLPIEVVPADRELTRLAAQFKVSNRMSYADCFVAALAKTKKVSTMTTRSGMVTSRSNCSSVS